MQSSLHPPPAPETRSPLIAGAQRRARQRSRLRSARASASSCCARTSAPWSAAAIACARWRIAMCSPTVSTAAPPRTAPARPRRESQARQPDRRGGRQATAGPAGEVERRVDDRGAEPAGLVRHVHEVDLARAHLRTEPEDPHGGPGDCGPRHARWGQLASVAGHGTRRIRGCWHYFRLTKPGRRAAPLHSCARPMLRRGWPTFLRHSLP